MDAGVVKQEIAELERLQSQTRWWRLGTGIVTAVFVLGCVAVINNSVQGLLQPGARQEAFVSDLSTGVQQNVLPSVQSLAEQALVEVRPEVETEFRKIGARVPEIAEASYEQLNQMHQSLPQRGERVLGDTFGKMMAEREQKIQAMFPDATEEQVHALTENLTNIAQERAVAVNDKLFSRHMSAMDGIVTNMEKIRLAEQSSAAPKMEPNWEMALAMLDVVRADLKEMAPPAQPGTMMAANSTNGRGSAASSALPNRSSKATKAIQEVKP